MDNQHLSSEEEKVQRLSHKGVPFDSFIIWEKPPIQNKIYIYKLKSNLSEEIRYIGITNNPKTRLCHHVIDKHKNYKHSWIKSIHNKNGHIIMIIFDMFDNLEEALVKEEYYINQFSNLTNLVLKPTSPHTKKCFLYDLKESKSISFNSLSSAANYLKIASSPLLYNRVIKGRYLFSYKDNFKKIIDDKYSIKLKKENIIIKCMSYNHACWLLNCSKGTISSCLSKLIKSINGYQICKRNEKFSIYKNNHWKKVKCLDDEKIFNMVKDAAKYYNINESSIIKCCKKHKHRNTAGGRKFEYVLDDDIVQTL